MRFKDLTAGLRFSALMLVVAVANSCSEPTGPVAPAIPTNVTATLISPTSAMVTWSPNPQNDGVLSYSIFRNAVKVGESVSTSFTDTGLEQLTTYVYSVAATSKGGASARSSETTASTIATPDVTKPTVVSNQPAANVNGVSPTASASVTFSEPMDPASITATTFSLKTAGGEAIPGSVFYTAATRTAEFRSTRTLPNPVSITATVSADAKDVAGNALAAPFNWSFTTRDETPPTINGVVPASAATGVSTAATVQITFSESMDPTSVNSGTLTLRNTVTGQPVSGTVAYVSATNSATFTPSGSLASLTGYTVAVTTGVKDVAGNAMTAAFTSTFTTVFVDTTPPTVASVSPANGSTGVGKSTTVQVAFSEAMDATTVNGSNVTLITTSSGTAVPATVTYNSTTYVATIAPQSALAGSTAYTVAVSTAVKDAAGNAMASTFTSAFTTTAGDNIAPVAISISPPNGAKNVGLNTVVEITFSEAMDVTTINGTNINLRPAFSTTPLPATLTYNPTSFVVTITPQSPLQTMMDYLVFVGTGVKDVAGNSTSSAVTTIFSTPYPDVTPPRVVGITPSSFESNTPLTITPSMSFSEAMDQSTINTSNFTLRNKATGALIAGVMSYDPGTNTALYNHSAPLENSTVYTLAASTGVKDLAGNALASPFSFDFKTIGIGDTTPPTIIARSPADGQTGVPLNANVIVTFSEAMNIYTIDENTIKLAPTSAPGAFLNTIVVHDTAAHTATLDPTSDLAYNTSYTVTVTTGAKDVPGNPLAAQSTWTFTTIPDTTPPTVTATSPVNGSTGILTTSSVTVTFSETMDATTINATTFTVRDDATSTNIAGTVSYNASTSVATFKPASPLTPDHGYTAMISTGAKDPGGNPLAASTSFSFTTNQDGVAPTIQATSPVDGATNVPISSVITVTFSENMDSTSINTSTFLLFDTVYQGFFSGTVTYNPSTHTATFTPRSVLATDRKYIAEITSFARDTAGNRFKENTTFTFTTAP